MLTLSSLSGAMLCTCTGPGERCLIARDHHSRRHFSTHRHGSFLSQLPLSLCNGAGCIGFRHPIAFRAIQIQLRRSCTLTVCLFFLLGSMHWSLSVQKHKHFRCL
ncbi:hypothetical protein DENSPDRAFT_320289 [Dentipellis sp. KUC8613]|nr:hypothetical protein DENSPDRAFT_320289 [Dentipellis sp. KUC8613]